MSKITLYQCDMCHKKSEDLYTYSLTVPVVDFEDEETSDEALERGGKPRSDMTEYDLCEDCIRNLRMFIETFHKTGPKKPERKQDDEGYIWFVECKQNSKSKWTRENGPFVNRKAADKALKNAELLNPNWEHKVSCRVVPAWVVDFIEYNVVKN